MFGLSLHASEVAAGDKTHPLTEAPFHKNR